MNEIIEIVFLSFYLFFPAYVATSLPLVAAGFKILKSLEVPIDGGKKINGIRLFGNHKTVRGFIVGIGGGTIIGIVQYIVAFNGFEAKNPVVDYTHLEQSLLFAFLASTGSLVGDAIKSSIKRRLNIAPGKSWLIADQIDYIVGTIVFTLPFFAIPISMIATYIVMAFVLYILSGVFAKIMNIDRGWL